MQSQLCPILIKLSQIILNVEEQNKLKLSKLLLISLDQEYFTDSFFIDTTTFSELNEVLSRYYLQKFNEYIKEEFFYQSQIDDRFIAIFKLILDIALNGQRKDQFLNSILEMSENHQNLLMQFVGQIVRRQEFINFDKNQDENFAPQLSKMSTQNIIMQQKFHQLKQEYSDLQKKYDQLIESHKALKQSNEKTLSQLSILKRQKLQLLGQFDLHPNSDLSDVIQKYRKQLKDFNLESERVHSQLQQKAGQLIRKQKYNQQLVLNFNSKQQQLTSEYQQKILLLSSRINSLQSQIQKRKQKSQCDGFEIDRLKCVLLQMKRQIDTKNIKLEDQQKIIDKFNKMKKLHTQFRKEMLQNYKSIGVNG